MERRRTLRYEKNEVADMVMIDDVGRVLISRA